MASRALPAALVALLAAPALAGCALPWEDGADDAGGSWWEGVPRPNETEDEPRVRVTFGGRVLDALSGDPVDDATVRLDLAAEAPCRRESILWRDWLIPVDNDGRFGPFEQPAPDSPRYRFFLHANAPGYTEEVVYVGPREAAQASNLTIVLHPRVDVVGTAPAGTIVALAGPEFPRFTVADADGNWSFDDARVDPTQVVVATPWPHRERVTPPATVDAPPSNQTGWAMQGVVKREDGRPIESRVVAWNGDALWSAAVTDEVGRFLLPLPAEPAQLRIEARTPNDDYGGVLARAVQGPPAAVETIVVRALC